MSLSAVMVMAANGANSNNRPKVGNKLLGPPRPGYGPMAAMARSGSSGSVSPRRLWLVATSTDAATGC
jgi:hypothetical protein